LYDLAGFDCEETPQQINKCVIDCMPADFPPYMCAPDVGDPEDSFQCHDSKSPGWDQFPYSCDGKLDCDAFEEAKKGCSKLNGWEDLQSKSGISHAPHLVLIVLPFLTS